MTEKKQTADCELALTTVTYNDRATLLLVIEEFLCHTKLDKPVCWYMALQNCSDAFVSRVVAQFNGAKNVTLVIARFQANIGLSKAMSYLIEQTKYFRYTLNIEDDWILLGKKQPIHPNWLAASLSFLESNPHATAVFMRAYAGAQDKRQYGWTRTIPYRNHQFRDNFNYEARMAETNDKQSHGGHVFQLIPNFLFTFNPMLVRNSDYHKHVYPIPILSNDQKDPKYQANWGCCEALVMEKTRVAGLKTYWIDTGVFGHHEDFYIL